MIVRVRTLRAAGDLADRNAGMDLSAAERLSLSWNEQMMNQAKKGGLSVLLIAPAVLTVPGIKPFVTRYETA